MSERRPHRVACCVGSWRASVLVAVLLAVPVLQGCRQEASDATGCSWDEAEVEDHQDRFADWREVMSRLAVESSDVHSDEEPSVFADMSELDDPDFAPEACIFRQVNVLRNALTIRFALFDDVSSLDAYLQRRSWPAINEYTLGVREGLFDSPYASRIEDVNGVAGANLYCNVGSDGQCDDFSLVRQWEECSPLVVEASAGGGPASRTGDQMLGAMLTATDRMYEHLRSPAVAIDCTVAEAALPEYRGPEESP